MYTETSHNHLLKEGVRIQLPVRKTITRNYKGEETFTICFKLLMAFSNTDAVVLLDQ